MVSLGKIDPQLSEKLSGRGVDHTDVEVLHEQYDVGSGEESANPDAVQFAVNAQRHFARLVDDVVADP